MSGTLTLEILTPERKRSIEGISGLTAQLADGSIGILPGHAPLLAQTITAPLTFRTDSGEEEEIILDSGILLVESGKVTIFIVGILTEARQLPVRLMMEGLANLAGVDGPDGEK